MATCKKLKDKYIKHLMSMDLDKLDMTELNTFAFIIKTLDETERGDYFDRMVKLMPWSNGTCAATRATDKEDKTDG